MRPPAEQAAHTVRFATTPTSTTGSAPADDKAERWIRRLLAEGETAVGAAPASAAMPAKVPRKA